MSDESKERTRGKAAALAFGLGAFGLHRFYLEEHGRGIAYAAFFWTFIPMLLGVRDGLRYLTMEEGRFDAAYNSAGLILRPHEERPAVPVGAPAAINVTVNAPGGGDGDLATKLEKLHGLKERGVLSDEEFAAQKAKLLEQG